MQIEIITNNPKCTVIISESKMEGRCVKEIKPCQRKCKQLRCCKCNCKEKEEEK